MSVIKSVNVSLNVISNYSRYMRVFELLVHLGARAYIVILLRALRARNLLLSRLSSCFIAAAVHRVSIEFPF